MESLKIEHTEVEDWQSEHFDPHSDQDVERLNAVFSSMTPEERIRAFYSNRSLSQYRVLLTSSFGTTAVYLLHLFYRENIHQPVHFLDTTYHFEETMEYKTALTRLFDLEVIELKPEEWKNKFTRDNQLWKTDPDLCCSVNKVEPLLTIRKQADIWISGLMSWQNDHRRQMDIFQKKEGVLKFYPVIDVSEEEANQYLEKFNLPIHPLKPLGYESIGCKHCTFKGKGRTGRWSGSVKTECGLHK